ncbi:hypothetical protein Acr_29g0000680 [Actinidia rufa]|uniref:Uncharacterized protein n=1 Tax=Actinidia rufa TaxID=165716 RepID=A0A7J0HCS6_9ERIC|nr:hypothetical protein Acr_29g0000680 [Actinidia rufa]
MDGRELNGLGYDYKDPVGCDPAYPDAGIFSWALKGENAGSDYTPKLEVLSCGFDNCGRRSVDLQVHIRKCWVIDGRQVTSSSRRNNFFCQLNQSQECPDDRTWRLRGRFTTEVNDSGGESRFCLLITPTPVAGLGNHMQTGPGRGIWKKRQYKERFHSSEVSMKPGSRKRRSPEESATHDHRVNKEKQLCKDCDKIGVKNMPANMCLSADPPGAVIWSGLLCREQAFNASGLQDQW